MISPQTATKVLDAALSTGADFAEIFAENTYSTEFTMSDGQPSKSLVGRLFGAGIRVFFGHEIVYVTTSDLSETALIKAARTAAGLRNGTPAQKTQPFKVSTFDSIHQYGTRAQQYSRDKKLGLLKVLDQEARQRSPLVTQVLPSLREWERKTLVINSQGVWVEDERNYSYVGLSVFAEKNGSKESASDRFGTMGTSDELEKVDLPKLAHRAADRAALLLTADYAPAGEMPVIIDGGFGGVIFHEACGHGLETTSVAKNASVFCGKLGEKVADACVTAIDDGLLANTWGSLSYDDEGLPTKKTTLIENGILKSYLVDQMGAKQTGLEATGSGRRQSYKLAPASRMRNTYIAAGTSSLDEMIRDIDFGLYAKVMGGGSVSPGTGDYNFGVNEAYIVKNGKIDRPVKGGVLIGRGIETLGRITKVGKEMTLEAGFCGSVSGNIPTTVGQPPILVSKMLVGGRAG